MWTRRREGEEQIPNVERLVFIEEGPLQLETRARAQEDGEGQASPLEDESEGVPTLEGASQEVEDPQRQRAVREH